MTLKPVLDALLEGERLEVYTDSVNDPHVTLFEGLCEECPKKLQRLKVVSMYPGDNFLCVGVCIL